jgi:hypothetical protein
MPSSSKADEVEVALRQVSNEVGLRKISNEVMDLMDIDEESKIDPGNNLTYLIS